MAKNRDIRKSKGGNVFVSASNTQKQMYAIVESFDRQTSLEEARRMMGEARELAERIYRQELKASNRSSVAEAAAANPAELHRITDKHFGFKIYEQPDYSEIDDYAWEFSQRYTTLEGVTLPRNAVFYTSDRKEVSRREVEAKMASGQFHLFDIALSNEYVLLGADEKFNVKDLEKRFSTNNEHLPPQSGSRRDGNTRVFKSDPRAIVISYIETNGDRGHLQVVFRDDQGKPIQSVALHRRPGQKHSELSVLKFDANGKRGQRYVIGPEDAPYYAYALALTHFANGFNENSKLNWFDRSQAEEVVNMLRYISHNGVDKVKEPVIRDILTDAKILKGNINPVALLPEMFAAALDKEIQESKFREARYRRAMLSRRGQAAIAVEVENGPFAFQEQRVLRDAGLLERETQGEFTARLREEAGRKMAFGR